ncbi:NAD(P)-dependent oxidoreductase [Cupriavidus pinatubonensis]|uniref:2-(Hydroxymethyl)glutarate dehydrogenase n=1 Tax=Cupriavidus pinatubonensis TaxID=248026 RepID=A0ABN7ZQ77_9BURK|nr:NAD(P)-dependent oxidoreductase [Cupriavidus pinatubonensis]CAG9187358.1 2-(hydroxymethyl)glutarate dehydrogenase [Cupriavidus pinatubonensis]
MKIGFIGTGKMGLPMARHIAAAGHDVVAYDIAPEQASAARHAGLAVAPSLADAVSAAEVIFSSMPNDGAFSAVAGQIAKAAPPGALYIDTSTVSPAASTAVAPLLAERDIAYLRVTVSGNNHMAEAAKLTALVSGPADAYERIKPLLAALGPAQFYLGDAEQARLMKLVVNLLIALTGGMLAEALTLGSKGGLGWQAMWDVITASAVASPIVKAKAEQLAVHDYTPTFTVEQMLKDVGLILDAGAQLHVPMGLTALLGQMLHGAAAQGMAGDDYAAIIKSAALAAGMQPGQRQQ